MANLIVPLMPSWSGVAIVAIAVYNRDKPGWQRDMRRMVVMGLTQVGLGVLVWF